MYMNHGLLDAIGVVPRRLSELVKVSQALGALGAKVTGAGGLDEMGGVGSVLVLPNESGARIKTALDIAGALVMEVKTGECGLKIEAGF
jgi:mevalonate kinase